MEDRYKYTIMGREYAREEVMKKDLGRLREDILGGELNNVQVNWVV